MDITRKFASCYSVTQGEKILFNGSMAECVEYLKKRGIVVEFCGLCNEKIKYSRI